MNDVRRTEQDWILFGLALLASLLGLVAVASASLVEDASLWHGIPVDALKQGCLLAAGIALFAGARALPGPWLKPVLWSAFILSVLGVAATFGPLGVEKNGQRLWLEIVPGFPFQPSEFVKASAILLTGLLFGSRGPEPELSRTPQTIGQALSWFVLPKMVHAYPLFVGMGGAAMVLAQKDMGTACVIVAAVLAMHLASGASLARWGAIVGCLALLACGFLMRSDYRAARIPNWQHRWEKGVREAGGYQQTISEAGISRGGLAGVGLTRGLAKTELPVGTSDFVMTTVAEETGIWGVGLVLATLGGLSLAMIRRSAQGGAAAVAWAGMGMWLLVQTFVNVGMANALLPAIGLPLPFVSTGGSTLVAIWAAMGGLIALSRQPAAEPRAVVYSRQEAPRAGAATLRTGRRFGHETRFDRRGDRRPRLSRP